MTDRLGAQGTVMAGGRYNGLVEEMGGPATPSVGWAAGMDRLAMLMEAAGAAPAVVRPVAVVPMDEGAETRAIEAAQALRAKGEVVVMEYRGAVKRRMERANKVRARAVVFVRGDGGLEWKDLETGVQRGVGLGEVG